MAEEEPTAVWMSIASPPGGGTHMRLAGRGGRVVVDAVYVHGPEVTASILQDVPVGHLGTAAGFAPALYDFLTVLKFGGFGYPVLTEQGAEDEPSLPVLRAQVKDAPPALRLIEEMKKPRPQLSRPDGTDPDGFSARVADAYREYAMETRAPAIRLAEEAGVPVATARSWIRESRRRGHLPPGQRGKAG